MLRISQLTLSRGTRRLLDGAELTVHDRHKVGVVGANGSGKSSLFATIRGELLPDAGAIGPPPARTLAPARQRPPPFSHQSSSRPAWLDADPARSAAPASFSFR